MNNQTSQPARHKAFTLVELLTVIAIIGILVSLLVPAIAGIQKQAKVAKTKTLIHTLDSGLQMYRGESRLGRDYPPSLWPPNGTDLAQADDPYGTGGYVAYGANTLLWAVAGPDLKGIAGSNGTGFPTGGQMWSYYNPTIPPKPRFGPYVEPSSLTIAGNRSLNVRDQARILDPFGRPILYFKAYSGTLITDIYRAIDNRGHYTNPRDFDPDPVNNPTGMSFPASITNLRAGALAIGAAQPTPYNRDSFILMSAGLDKFYGSTDDIFNFTKQQ